MGEEDNAPFADPTIRLVYEAALGRFVLAYNEVDFRVSELIRFEFEERTRADLNQAMNRGSFLQRLDVLEILATCVPPLTNIPFARLRAIHGDRNKLAHGHFDQNPFDGSYAVVAKSKSLDYPSTRIGALADELALIAESMRMAEAWYDFDTVAPGQAPPAPWCILSRRRAGDRVVSRKRKLWPSRSIAGHFGAWRQAKKTSIVLGKS